MTTETTAQPAVAPAPASEGITATPAPVGTPTPQPVTIVETVKPTLDEELSAIYDKINPKEDPKAVIAAALTAGDEPELPLEDKPNSDQPETKASEQVTSSPAIAPPQSWSADVKAKWAAIPPEVQSYIADREKASHQRISQQGNELASFTPVREIYGWIRGQGVPAGQEPEVIANWARAQAALDKNPIEGLKWLANSYGVDIAQLAGTQRTQDGTQPIDDLFRDPRVDLLTRKIEEADRRSQTLERQLQARANAEQSSEQQYAESVIDQFSNGKDDWNDVADDVVAEIQVLKDRIRQGAEQPMPHEKLLEKAYDRARYANPVIRQRIKDEEIAKDREKQDAARAKEVAESAKKAEQAKKAQSMNVRSGATASTPRFDGKWDDRDNLSALYDRVSGGSSR